MAEIRTLKLKFSRKWLPPDAPERPVWFYKDADDPAEYADDVAWTKRPNVHRDFTEQMLEGKAQDYIVEPDQKSRLRIHGIVGHYVPDAYKELVEGGGAPKVTSTASTPSQVASAPMDPDQSIRQQLALKCAVMLVANHPRWRESKEPLGDAMRVAEMLYAHVSESWEPLPKPPKP